MGPGGRSVLGGALAAVLLGGCAPDAQPSGTTAPPTASAAAPSPTVAEPDSPAGVLRRAADATIATGTARIGEVIGYRGSSNVPDGPSTATTGSVSLTGPPQMTSEINVPRRAGTIQMLLNGDLFLIRGDYAENPPAGEKWLVVDLASRDPRVDDYRVYADKQDDAALTLYFLYGATGVQEGGREELEGIPTTLYSMRLDLEAAADEMPEPYAQTLREIIANGASVGWEPIIDANVWIDDDGRVRVIDTVNRVVPQLGGGEELVTFTYGGYGEPLDLEIPADDDVVYLENLPVPSGPAATPPPAVPTAPAT